MARSSHRHVRTRLRQTDRRAGRPSRRREDRGGGDARGVPGGRCRGRRQQRCSVVRAVVTHSGTCRVILHLTPGLTSSLQANTLRTVGTTSPLARSSLTIPVQTWLPSSRLRIVGALTAHTLPTARMTASQKMTTTTFRSLHKRLSQTWQGAKPSSSVPSVGHMVREAHQPTFFLALPDQRNQAGQGVMALRSSLEAEGSQSFHWHAHAAPRGQ
jgi:hypothetical protein